MARALPRPSPHLIELPSASDDLNNITVKYLFYGYNIASLKIKSTYFKISLVGLICFISHYFSGLNIQNLS